MAHGLGFAGQVVQGADDAVGDVEEGQAAGLAAGIEQALRDLRADLVQQLGCVGGEAGQQQVVEALVADLGQFARRAGAQHDFAALAFHEQAEFADELARAEVAQDQLTAVVFLGDDADRAGDQVVDGVGRVARAEHVGARRVAAAVAMREEALDGRVVRHQRAVGLAQCYHGDQPEVIGRGQA